MRNQRQVQRAFTERAIINFLNGIREYNHEQALVWKIYNFASKIIIYCAEISLLSVILIGELSISFVDIYTLECAIGSLSHDKYFFEIKNESYLKLIEASFGICKLDFY